LNEEGGSGFFQERRREKREGFLLKGRKGDFFLKGGETDEE
jgi:hypothetical protein